MPIEIVVPRLGWNMDEGVFAGWLKRDGESVRAGDPIFSLEGEKATQDVESIDQGTLHIPSNGPSVGDKVAVGAVIGHLLNPGEAEPADRTVPAVSQALTITPPARAISTKPHDKRIKISPLARRIARELGIDWTTLEGTGCTGRIRKVDVLAVARIRPDEPRTTRKAPVSPIRRTIAARMVESHRATAPVTLTTTVDATNLVNLRLQFKAMAADGRKSPSYTDFAVKLTALALRDHPLLNSRWDDDQIIVSDEIHVGIAVDTEAGLVVPVIRDAARLGLRQIATRSGDLIERAREQTLRAEEMHGGTFTITNLGSFGIETFTPIINPPQCAILGLGRIQREPVMVADQVVGRERLRLSLTFDHRIVDGAPAARFLQSLGQMIENPGPWLIS